MAKKTKQPPLDPNKPLPPKRKLRAPNSGYHAIDFDQLEGFLSNLSREQLILLLIKGANACAFEIFERDATHPALGDGDGNPETDEIMGWPPRPGSPSSKKSGKKAPSKKTPKKSSQKSSKKAAKKRR